MRLNFFACHIPGLVTMLGILLCNGTPSQTNDTIPAIKPRLPYEYLYLYDADLIKAYGGEINLVIKEGEGASFIILLSNSLITTR